MNGCVLAARALANELGDGAVYDREIIETSLSPSGQPSSCAPQQSAKRLRRECDVLAQEWPRKLDAACEPPFQEHGAGRSLYPADKVSIAAPSRSV